MTVLFFNSNSVWFGTPPDIVLGDHLQDGDLFNVHCLCNSWPVNDLYQEWGVKDFPEQSAVRIANFWMVPAPDYLIEGKDSKEERDTYGVILHPVTGPGAPILVFCDAASNQFFGVATNRESARRLAEVEGKEVWITVAVAIVNFEGVSWPELAVHRENSENWAQAQVRFA